MTKKKYQHYSSEFKVLALRRASEDGDEAAQSCAVSREVYDLILRAEEAGDSLEKTEAPEDFPRANSQDFQDCFDSVKSLTDDLWLLVQGAAACEKRHPCQQSQELFFMMKFRKSMEKDK